PGAEGSMPAPATANDLLGLVRTSGLVEAQRLAEHVERLRASGEWPDAPSILATLFIRDGLLTHFQAEQLLPGRWKHFATGTYKVLERLGAGKRGMVYLCEHTLMRRRFAVKVLPLASAENTAALERFYREARALAGLHHANVVRAYEIDQRDKLHFL